MGSLSPVHTIRDCPDATDADRNPDPNSDADWSDADPDADPDSDPNADSGRADADPNPDDASNGDACAPRRDLLGADADPNADDAASDYDATAAPGIRQSITHIGPASAGPGVLKAACPLLDRR